MRQELLAHLVAAFEQEMPLATSEDAAIDRATERLGILHAVREELQSSVSLKSRLDFYLERWSCRSDGGSQLLHASKVALALGVGGVISLLVLFSVPYFFGVVKCDGVKCEIQTLVDVWPQMLGAGLRLFPFLFLATFNSTLFAAGVSEIVAKHPRFGRACWILLRQAMVVLMALFCQAAVSVGISLIDEPAFGKAPEMFFDLLFWCGFYSAIAALCVLPLAWLNARKQRVYAEWMKLDLEHLLAD
jgi:hypothetical protein